MLTRNAYTLIAAMLVLPVVGFASEAGRTAETLRSAEPGAATSIQRSSPTVMPSPARSMAARRPTAEERALLEIEAEGQARVTELSRLSGSLAPGPERDALLRRAAETKRDTRASLLRTRADFARRRGDILGARAIEDALSALLAPRPVSPADVQAPIKSATRDGGRP